MKATGNFLIDLVLIILLGVGIFGLLAIAFAFAVGILP